ncbi:hypothetical protein MBOT_06210 [Mycobacterium botniense]|uniref:Glycosyl hydrolase family 92 domain-containing protein n=1 Tax=Mycobacterium botniense TaxID=84962 RepID=A0A7I9XV09_9MYCO|nr:hypothetical protein MBOT_06210 [Mycobacterium botniense]
MEFAPGSVLEVRTALSSVSVDGARANLAAEGGAGFDAVRAAASSAWHAALSRSRVAAARGDQVKTFYTALYHSRLHPNTFHDADGAYLGFDGVVHTVARGHTQYANFSDWDTYRCLAALQALLFPQRASDMAQSLVNDAEQSGSLRRWALTNAASGEMTEDSVVPLIVNLYTFGAKDFDVKRALYYMLKAASDGGGERGGYVQRPGITTCLEHGYAPQTVPFRGDHGIDGASITLEWSVDDFAIFRFVDALGEPVIAAEFHSRAQYWRNVFNPPDRLHHAPQRRGDVRAMAKIQRAHFGFGEGRIRRGHRRAVHLDGAAEHRRPGGRPRWTRRGGRAAGPLRHAAQRRPGRAVSVARQRTRLRGAVAVQLSRSTVEDAGDGGPGAQRTVRADTGRRAR